VAGHGNQLMGHPGRLEKFFRLQGVADGRKNEHQVIVIGVLRQGRTTRPAPARISTMSYILEMCPTAT